MTQGAYNMRKQVESEESDRDEEDGEQIKLQGLIRPSAVVQAPTLCRRDPHCDLCAIDTGRKEHRPHRAAMHRVVMNVARTTPLPSW